MSYIKSKINLLALVFNMSVIDIEYLCEVLFACIKRQIEVSKKFVYTQCISRCIYDVLIVDVNFHLSWQVCEQANTARKILLQIMTVGLRNKIMANSISFN